MIASGWRTAPPHDYEAVLVTNSRCLLALEASSRVPDLHPVRSDWVAAPASSRSAVAASLCEQLAVLFGSEIAHIASASRNLSAPLVS